MPHTDVIPTSASTASTGLGIRYVGHNAYAYSGSIDVDGTETTLLDFTTGAGYITAIFQGMYYQNNETDNMEFNLKLNDNIVADFIMGDSTVPINLLPIYLVIPPLTHVIVNGQNIGSSSPRAIGINMVGMVHGAE